METSKRLFYYEETPCRAGWYLIRPNFDLLPLKGTRGSYNIFAARLMGLSYASYLRMCRDVLGAELKGAGTRYPFPYFKMTKEVYQFIELLNQRAKFILWLREHPHHKNEEWQREYTLMFGEERGTEWEK